MFRSSVFAWTPRSGLTATVGPGAFESSHQEVRLAVAAIGGTRFAHVKQRECPRVATSVEALVSSSPVRAVLWANDSMSSLYASQGHERTVAVRPFAATSSGFEYR